MSKKIIIAALAAGASILATSSFAFADTAKSNGFYVGANVGYAQVRETVVFYDYTLPSKTDGFGWNVDAGYLFNKNFALEAAFLGYPNETFDPDVKGSNNYAGALAAVGIIPFDSGFNIFGKLGIAAVHHELKANNGAILVDGDESRTNAACYGAAGVGYAITKNVGINIAVNTTTKNSNTTPPMWQATAGLSYIF